MEPAEAKLSGAALKLTSEESSPLPCYPQVSECQGSARATTCLLMCAHRVVANAPSTDLPPSPPMVFRGRGVIRDFQGRDPSTDALLRISSGSPGSSANLVAEAIIAHHKLLATRVQMSSSRWYGSTTTRLAEIRARLEIWEIEHDQRSHLCQRHLEVCCPGVSFLHTISPTFTDGWPLHYLRFHPIVLLCLHRCRMSKMTVLSPDDSCLQGTVSRNSADPEHGKP